MEGYVCEMVIQTSVLSWQERPEAASPSQTPSCGVSVHGRNSTLMSTRVEPQPLHGTGQDNDSNQAALTPGMHQWRLLPVAARTPG